MFDDDDKECPECGRPMVERFNNRTGEFFYGCSGYPLCRETASAEEEEE